VWPSSSAKQFAHRQRVELVAVKHERQRLEQRIVPALTIVRLLGRAARNRIDLDLALNEVDPPIRGGGGLCIDPCLDLAILP